MLNVRVFFILTVDMKVIEFAHYSFAVLDDQEGPGSPAGVGPRAVPFLPAVYHWYRCLLPGRADCVPAANAQGAVEPPPARGEPCRGGRTMLKYFITTNQVKSTG